VHLLTQRENVRLWLRFLLEQDDVDLNAKDSEGNTPLHLALESGQEVVSMLLMQHGADVTSSNNFGRTPLHFAALQGMEQVAFAAPI
jgi:ankyrin repeat protein